MTEQCLQPAFNPSTIGRCVWRRGLISDPASSSVPLLAPCHSRRRGEGMGGEEGGHPGETTSACMSTISKDSQEWVIYITWALGSCERVIKPICDQARPPFCIKFPLRNVPSPLIGPPPLTSVSAESRLRVTFPWGSGLLRSTVMCKVRRRSPRSSSSSAASRTILLTRPLLGACGVAGAPTPTPPPPGAETPISGSAGDEEPQHHFGATSGIRIAKSEGKRIGEGGESNNLREVLR